MIFIIVVLVFDIVTSMIIMKMNNEKKNLNLNPNIENQNQNKITRN